MKLAARERSAICDLLDELGPTQPTLCEGWNTADLAAHLVLREGRPDAMPGIALKFLAGHTARVQKSLAAKDFRQLVNTLRNGPPRFSPFRPGPIDEAANGIEFVVHHEDIRRAQPSWQPRTFDRAAQDLFFKRLRFATASALRGKTIGVDAVRSDTGEQLTARRPAPAAPTVTVTGLPSELLIYFFRQGHAIVEADGAVF